MSDHRWLRVSLLYTHRCRKTKKWAWSVNTFLSIRLNICFKCSKELSHWDGSFEYPKHMLWFRNKKTIFFYLCTLTHSMWSQSKISHKPQRQVFLWSGSNILNKPFLFISSYCFRDNLTCSVKRALITTHKVLNTCFLIKMPSLAINADPSQTASLDSINKDWSPLTYR